MKREIPGTMSHVFKHILSQAARVKFIDGGARKSDPDDCDDDSFQLCFSMEFWMCYMICYMGFWICYMICYMGLWIVQWLNGKRLNNGTRNDELSVKASEPVRKRKCGSSGVGQTPLREWHDLHDLGKRKSHHFGRHSPFYHPP